MLLFFFEEKRRTRCSCECHHHRHHCAVVLIILCLLLCTIMRHACCFVCLVDDKKGLQVLFQMQKWHRMSWLLEVVICFILYYLGFSQFSVVLLPCRVRSSIDSILHVWLLSKLMHHVSTQLSLAILSQRLFLFDGGHQIPLDVKRLLWFLAHGTTWWG
jgi:hypothetical protein